MNRFREDWRAVVATWGGAAWLVLQQFGVATASAGERETRIVRIEKAGTTLQDRERLPSGEILTIPVDHSPDARMGDVGSDSMEWSTN